MKSKQDSLVVASRVALAVEVMVLNALNLLKIVRVVSAAATWLLSPERKLQRDADGCNRKKTALQGLIRITPSAGLDVELGFEREYSSDHVGSYRKMEKWCSVLAAFIPSSSTN